MKVSRSNFEEVKTLWQNFLWPNRVSPIESISWINHLGLIDPSLQHSSSTFWKCVDGNGQIVGVISGQKTSEQFYRSRGLWVKEDQRRQGVGSLLIKAIVAEAGAQGCSTVWTMPRVSAWPFYESNGFEKIKQITEYEGGPHYIALMNL